MPYTKKVWVDRTVERPLTYIQQDNGDGTITLIPSEGSIISSGTPITADNLNNIENGVAAVTLTADDLAEYPKIVLKNGTVPRYESLDLNNFNQAGFYVVNKMLNAPPIYGFYNPDQWLYLEVIVHDDTEYILQKATDFHNGTWVRRRVFVNSSFVWTNWATDDTEQKQYCLAERTGAGMGIISSWQRLRFTTIRRDEGKMYTPNFDTFKISVGGWYNFSLKGYMVQSYGSGFYVEAWKINATDKFTVVSTWAPVNGWNYYYGEQTIWCDVGSEWEFVCKHSDGGYSRDFSGFICGVEKR